MEENGFALDAYHSVVLLGSSLSRYHVPKCGASETVPGGTIPKALKIFIKTSLTCQASNQAGSLFTEALCLFGDSK